MAVYSSKLIEPTVFLKLLRLFSWQIYVYNDVAMLMEHLMLHSYLIIMVCMILEVAWSLVKLIDDICWLNSEEAGELPNQSVDKTSGNVVAPPASESLDNVAVAPKDAQPTVNLSYQGSAARPKYRLGQNLCMLVNR